MTEQNTAAAPPIPISGWIEAGIYVFSIGVLGLVYAIGHQIGAHPIAFILYAMVVSALMLLAAHWAWTRGDAHHPGAAELAGRHRHGQPGGLLLSDADAHRADHRQPAGARRHSDSNDRWLGAVFAPTASGWR